MKELLSALVAVAFALTAAAQEKKGADQAIVPAAPAEKAAPEKAPAKKESKKKKAESKKGGADQAIVPAK
ncbi:MAG TPA: hypothetical protein VFR85_00215 [Anaeromyxobacteraceae bacterium]|nr:hypothetical protein [Anaeromyxobacteraceae bacterium]